MLPIHVALVTYAPGVVAPEDLLQVCSALQTQVTRDFTPLWETPAIVSPFLSLQDVPPGYIPLVIVAEGRLLKREHAFHLAQGGQPLAVIEARRGWSLLASHELLETLADPWGSRVVRGSSLADANPEAVQGKAGKQGQVEYLLEVCDPCQHTTYMINGVLVSDFVTPHFYDPIAVRGARYSLTGQVVAPRQVLPGGYVSWFCRGARDEVWQAFGATGGKLVIRRLSDASPPLSRAWVDANAAAGSPDTAAVLTRGRLLRGAERAYAEARAANQRYGTRVQTLIDGVLGSLDESSPAAVDRQEVVKLVHKLSSDKRFWERFRDDEKWRKQQLKRRGLPDLDLPEVPSMSAYGAVHAALTSRADSPLDPPHLAPDLATLAMFGSTG
jgi:hypothetical protein